MRLLWGSRLNASTRMTALLAIGILVSTAFGVIVVGMVNKGFSAILRAETTRMRDAPKFTVSFGAQVGAQDPRITDAFSRRAQAENEFVAAWGQDLPPEWHYRSTRLLLVPEANLPALVKARKAFDERMPPPLPKDATREAQVLRQAKFAELSQAMVDMSQHLRLAYGTACAAHGVGPTEIDDTWVLRTWGEVGQAEGSSWVGMIEEPAHSSRIPFHKKLKVVQLATRRMRATGCEFWISPRLVDILERRYPASVVLSMRSTQPPPRRLIDKWFDNNSSYAAGPRGKPYLSGAYAFPTPLDNSVQSLVAAERVLGVQRLVSWLVVGMMGALSIYQVCSLMMMLGLHFRFDVAMLRSLGMARWRVMMVFVVSSIVIMSAGLGVGMLAAWWWLPHMNAHLKWLLAGLGAADLVDWVPWMQDRRFAWSAFGIGMLLGLFAALIPAWMASRARPSDIWKEET